MSGSGDEDEQKCETDAHGAILQSGPLNALSLALILVAALVHIVPHAAIKGAADRTAFVWWMLGGTVVLYVPALWLDVMPAPRAWLLILASGAVEVVYLLSISRAYSTGDLSVVYPLARGSAPLFLIVFSLFVLREPLTRAGAGGVLLIAAGVYLVGGGHLFGLPRSAGLGWAATAGLTTALYTTIDKIGVRYVHPLTYIYLVMLVSWIFYTPVTLLRSGRQGIRATLTASPLRVALAAAAMPLAYALVLIAMRLGTFASYAGSVREVSVIIASAVGAVAFGERVTKLRMAGAALILAGVVLIAVSG